MHEMQTCVKSCKLYYQQIVFLITSLSCWIDEAGVLSSAVMCGLSLRARSTDESFCCRRAIERQTGISLIHECWRWRLQAAKQSDLIQLEFMVSKQKGHNCDCCMWSEFTQVHDVGFLWLVVSQNSRRNVVMWTWHIGTILVKLSLDENTVHQYKTR